MTTRIKNRTLLGGVVLFPLFILSCVPGGLSPQSQEPSGTLSRSVDLQEILVRTAGVERTDLERVIRLAGEIHATEIVSILPDTTGILTRLLISSGDYVQTGDVIAYVDPSRPGMNYAESPVVARSPGTVTNIPVVEGNMVSTQSVIAQLGNLQKLEAETAVSERYLASLRPGLRGRLTSRAYPDQAIGAQVSEIAPVVNPQSRTVDVTLVPDSFHTIRPGQSVTIELILETRRNVLAVPENAIVERRDGFGVYVVEGDDVRWTPVERGLSQGSMVEILSGLEDGLSIVTSGHDDLTDGSLIRILG